MGMFDRVWIPCPQCHKEHEAQSKWGECTLQDYYLDNVPAHVMEGAGREFTCEHCGCQFKVETFTFNKVVRL